MVRRSGRNPRLALIANCHAADGAIETEGRQERRTARNPEGPGVHHHELAGVAGSGAN
jgi:hypothetical protein